MGLRSKIILITGSTDGIGKQFAFDAAAEGAEVIIHGRTEERLMQTINGIKNKTGNENVYGVLADFSSLLQVREMTKEIKTNFSTIDILINNAAEIIKERTITSDGYERQFQVNYLAHFLITEELLPIIKDEGGSRIINVSSMIHAPTVDFTNLQGEKMYSGSSAYALTKALNILYTYNLAERLSYTKTGVFCMHPGVIETKLLNSTWSGGSPVTEGAANIMYVAKSEALEQMTGLYLENGRPMRSNSITYDKAAQAKLREISLEMVKK
jgi:NAD(P)-dependent dehydrogenase (short-subunit alcohol dehydrogenase family)